MQGILPNGHSYALWIIQLSMCNLLLQFTKEFEWFRGLEKADKYVLFWPLRPFVATKWQQFSLFRKIREELSDFIRKSGSSFSYFLSSFFNCSNPVVAGIVYWLIRILICGGCLVGAGIFLAFIGIKIAKWFVQLVYVTIRWYAKECYNVKGIKY